MAFQARGDQPLHVPFLIGSVSFFHNVPGMGDGFFLDPCTLARIFRGDVVSRPHVMVHGPLCCRLCTYPALLALQVLWNDTAIVQANPQFLGELGAGTPIRVVHRNNGSSSTYAITNYFKLACPEQWNAVAGASGTGPLPSQSRSVGSTTEWPAVGEGLHGRGVHGCSVTALQPMNPHR
jgi:ABC-type phosphate transport system substrate-binding protein